MSHSNSAVVLWGVGHTNAHVLRMWRMTPLAGASLTCISDQATATYSGMLPGVLAGLYPRDRMEIDLVRLCAAAGARLIVGEVTGLDRINRRLLLAERPAIPFDVLSIGIGSVSSGARTAGDVIAVKPMQTFLDRIDERLERTKARPLCIVVVGGGAGGLEVAFCLPAHVRRVLGDVPWELTLIDAQPNVGAGFGRGLAARVRRTLDARGVRLRLDRRVVDVAEGVVTLDDGATMPADLVVWATSASAPPILGRLGLPTDDRGFLRTRTTLQTIDDPAIFAVGDAGTMVSPPHVPKAGVYAVRQGPILWTNIVRQLAGRRPEPYIPQSGFLKLLNTGDGRALGEYMGVAFQGRWCWKLKDAIDSRFIKMYHDYQPMPRSTASSAPMRCAGCGGKVSGSVLANVLRTLDNPVGPEVLVGLDAPDDAAVVRTSGGGSVALTVDFFEAPIDDPYLVGRIAALHAASDAYAIGARPVAALALATLPVGPQRMQEQTLTELLAGGLREFRRMGASLVGGHTIEGPRLTIGFTILAEPGPIRRKGGLRIGDQLVLTKPLGTGILLAAHARALCRARWFEALLKTMLASNQDAAALVEEFDVQGLTDVTGFGLAGHLLEMLTASGLSAALRLDQVPLLPGVAEMYDLGIESTLAPANRATEAAIDMSGSLRASPAYAALFDPQTSGGLLLGVPERHAAAVLDRLRAQDDLPVALVGRVVGSEDGQARIGIRA